jgi:hypothetical protein
MITTRSQFYYGYEVTEDNCSLDFAEGGSEIQATLNFGLYSLTTLVTEIARALFDANGALDYTVSVNRTTRIITIAATGTFQILISTGSRAGTGVYGLLGYTGGADLTGAASYVAPSATGTSFRPQFLLQSYTASEDYEGASNASVNESGSGKVEVISFGQRNFMECNISFQTDNVMPNGAPIEYDPAGVAHLRAFMQWARTKGPIEFMPNRDMPTTFETFILETTPEEKTGTMFKLHELYAKKLPGYFETGLLKFRTYS